MDLFEKQRLQRKKENEIIDVVARTLWGEARGEGLQGMEAVACVINNRYKISKSKESSYWWGNTLIEICKKPYQFSCWNKADINYKKLICKIDDEQFLVAKRISSRLYRNLLNDITNGADHYHSKVIKPSWAEGVDPVKIILNHIFYKLVVEE